MSRRAPHGFLPGRVLLRPSAATGLQLWRRHSLGQLSPPTDCRPFLPLAGRNKAAMPDATVAHGGYVLFALPVPIKILLSRVFQCASNAHILFFLARMLSACR